MFSIFFRPLKVTWVYRFNFLEVGYGDCSWDICFCHELYDRELDELAIRIWIFSSSLLMIRGGGLLIYIRQAHNSFLFHVYLICGTSEYCNSKKVMIYGSSQRSTAFEHLRDRCFVWEWTRR